MNCEQFQERLYDYMDGTLSAPEKAEADRHLHECSICRGAAQRETQLGQTLSEQLRRAVAPVVMDANDERVMARAVQRRMAKPRQHAFFARWPRLALPLGAAALILTGGFWIGYRMVFEGSPHLSASGSLPVIRPTAPVDFSYSVPDYTFHKDGTTVVDSLTCHTLVVEGALLARK